MIGAVVDEVLKEMENATNEGMKATDDYMDTETGLLMCGKCHTIDDLGVERDTPYVLETVYLVIDERYKSGKPFIITTNLSLEELRNPADLEHGRIYDRIMERCVPVAFSGKNYRTDKGRKNMENAAGILKHETV